MIPVRTSENFGFERVGSKVANLIRLSSDLPVPPIIGLVQEAPDDYALPLEVDAFIKRIGPGSLFAIRSSANLEDTAGASFAGMFDTVLGVRDDGVVAAIRKVAASFRSDRVQVYCREKGIDPRSIHLAVGVQQMVDAMAAGVAFSSAPDAPSVMVVDAVAGLGELLVQGKVSPESWRIDRKSLTIVSVIRSPQRDALRLVPTGGTALERIPSVDRRAARLSSTQALSVARMALAAERHLGCPADIEWALDLERLLLVQARPLTGYASPSRRFS